MLYFTGVKAADFYEPIPIIMRELLHRLNDDSSIVLKANNLALGALTSCVPAEELGVSLFLGFLYLAITFYIVVLLTHFCAFQLHLPISEPPSAHS